MTPVLCYAHEIIKVVQKDFLINAALSTAMAFVCHKCAMTAFITICNSFVCVPLIITSFIITHLGNHEKDEVRILDNQSFAISMLSIVFIFQTNLSFLKPQFQFIWWLIPRVLIIKITYDLYSKVENLEFRSKKHPLPPAYQ